MKSNGIVCVTTFRQGDPKNVVENTRSEVFFDTVHEVLMAGLSLVVVYTKTQKSALKILRQLGVILVEQQSTSMGTIRREAFQAAYARLPNAQYFCWLEPEKPDLVKYIAPMALQMKKERSALGIYNRNEMMSYPREQAHYYLFCRAVATQLIGFEIDYAFGPMLMTRSSISYFLDYQGEYGDKWDSILIPRLRVIQDKLGVTVLSVDFQNDSRMTRVESGNSTIILKRLEQLNNVIPSLIAEWKRLSKS